MEVVTMSEEYQEGELEEYESEGVPQSHTYLHATDGQYNTGLNNNLTTVTGGSDALNQDDAESVEDIITDKFRQLVREAPESVLASAELKTLSGGIQKRIQELRTGDEGHLINTKVQVDFVSEVFSLPKSIEYRCKSCGETQTIQQDTKTEWRKDPPVCGKDGCRSQQFNSDNKSLVDKQIAVVSDMPDGDGTPDTTVLHLYGVHIGQATAGDTIRISGVVKHVEVSPNQNETKEEREIVVTHLVNEDAPDINLTEQDKVQFESLDQPVEALVKSLAPHLVGLDTEKRGLLHLITSGHDEMDARTISHGLLIGDPSSGKSALLEEVNKVVPKSIIASSESASGVGMTAAAEREERLGGKWICRAGVLVKAHGGHAFVDELDEFYEDDLAKLLTALQSEEVRVNKASINQTLPASTRFVGAANPKEGEFNPFEPYNDQFDFPAPLLARMDLVYVFTDTEDDDGAVADAIMGRFTTGDEQNQDVPLSPDQIRKYLHYVLTEYQPTVPREAREYAAEVWIDLRQQTDGAIDKRDAKSILRLAIASARLNRRNEITIEDVETAQALKIASLEQVGHGEIDATVKYTGETSDQSNTRNQVLKATDLLENTENGVTEDDLVDKLVANGHDEDTVRHYVDQHLKQGNLMRQDGGEIVTV
jgi:replicative DNA helicase Mcm